MIDLTKKVLPNTVLVGGKAFSIYTDYRVWMKFSIEFEKWTKGGCKGTLDIQYLFKNELPVFKSPEDYNSLLTFAFPQNVLPHTESSDGDQVLYFAYDCDYIYSAFLQQYGIDLIDAEELHWWKFRALLNGIGKDTKLGEIMGYRAYTGEKVKDMDSQYRKLKESWMPPLEETEEDRRTAEEFDDFFE